MTTEPGWETDQLARMIRSVQAVGYNQRIAYTTILTDVVTRRIDEGEIACALVAAPYVKLAQHACPSGVEGMTLAE